MSAFNGKSKNQNLKGFLFFLVLASIIWLLTNFSEDKEARIIAGIAYKDVPSETTLTEQTNSEVELTVLGNGFQLLYYRLKRPIIEIPVSEFYDGTNLKIIISELNFKSIALEYLNVKDIRSNTNWSIQLDQSTRKKVPIVTNTNLKFQTGYRALHDMVVSPDSIWVEGPSEIIQKITELSTEPINKQNLNSNISEEILIEKPLSGISYETDKVLVSMPIKEFTQKQIDVPVQLIGAPVDATVKLLPKSVQVSLEVAVDSFGDVSADDFEIVCDFKDKIEAETILIPKITKKPEAVFNITMQPRKIEYLIFK